MAVIDDKNIQETILEKLTPVERFCFRAKKYLDWNEWDDRWPGAVMDYNHIELLSPERLQKREDAVSVNIDLKKLRTALLAFERNGCTVIHIEVKQNHPIELSDVGVEKDHIVYYYCAQRIDPDD